MLLIVARPADVLDRRRVAEGATPITMATWDYDRARGVAAARDRRSAGRPGRVDDVWRT